jgi:hypothetical protein
MRVIFLLLCSICGPLPLLPADLGTEEIRGAAIGRTGQEQVLFTWGDRLRRWDLRTLTSEVLAQGPFGEGGCLVDSSLKGGQDLVLVEGRGLGTLVRLEAPRWTRRVLDSEVEMHDCRGTTLFGRAGVLVVQRFMQIRFYQAGAVQDIYSFYTASEQAGLLLAEIDGDGREDILCGNYWIRAPEKYDMPWRLYAINVMHQKPQSARFRLALLDPAGGLVAAQGEMAEAEVVLFRKPSDPREQWPAQPLDPDIRWAYPHGLLAADFDGDGRSDAVVGENNGPDSRLFIFWNRGQDRFLRRPLATGIPALAVFRFGASLVIVGPHGLVTRPVPARPVD